MEQKEKEQMVGWLLGFRAFINERDDVKAKAMAEKIVDEIAEANKRGSD